MPGEGSPVPIEQGFGWAPEPLGMFSRKRECITPAWNRTLNRPGNKREIYTDYAIIAPLVRVLGQVT
jgi:hypothetical protein